ncbi:DAZ-associated protein 1 isoform X4 [Dermochelys coriacea]|uniref:DAZ-associated protein 1 isoform X4 n=1 Tax=Dermochelys coriacea TaxID=27794 RepID=UPI001CAA40C0|nr:DAZ-associated protein 1 isoform X4 [Dermochelys coriacea]
MAAAGPHHVLASPRWTTFPVVPCACRAGALPLSPYPPVGRGPGDPVARPGCTRSGGWRAALRGRGGRSRRCAAREGSGARDLPLLPPSPPGPEGAGPGPDAAWSRRHEQRGRRRRDRKGPRSDNSKSNKIFVGGIPHNCGETELREYFKKFGVVTEVVMIYDAEKQRPRGFGFITFEDEQSVDQAVNMHFHDIMGKKVEVKRAEPRDSKSQTPGPPGASQWGSRIMPSAANGWAGQPPPTWQQGYSPQGMWVPAGQAIGGYGPPPPGRGAPPPPPPFTSYIVSTPPGGFPPPQGFPQGYGTPPPFSFGYGAPPPPPDQFAPPGVPPPPATPGATPLAFPPPPPPSQATQDMSKPPTAQPEFPYSQFGLGTYSQDPSGYAPILCLHSYGQAEQ